MAFIKLSTGRQIDRAKSDLSKEIRESEERLSKELARKDLMDARLAELDRRLTKTEAWKEAVSVVGPSVVNGKT